MTCGDAVAALIAQHFGKDCLWLDQVRDGVVGFVDRCVQTLNTEPPVRAQALAAGAPYRERARTAEEIKATPASDERAVTKAPPRRMRTEEHMEIETVMPDPDVRQTSLVRPQKAPKIVKPTDAGFTWGA